MTDFDASHFLDLNQYPLHALDSAAGRELVARCKQDLALRGMFNLCGFLRPQTLSVCVPLLESTLATNAFVHKRWHNIYFKNEIPGLAPDHPALKQFETINRTICADQFPDSILCKIYEWPPLARFLAETMGKPGLYTMTDPLARVNVMAYGEGDALGWHFDRAEFTTTLLLQEPSAGGVFEYRSNLRTETDPNYEGVARLMEGTDIDVQRLLLSAGTLNVFKGKNTAHRVSPIVGNRQRIVSVFSYYDVPGVMFSRDEQMSFYGRAA